MTLEAKPAGGCIQSIALAAKQAADLLNAKTTRAHSNKKKRTGNLALLGLKDAGISVAAWAQANGFSIATTKSVLYGYSKNQRGESHRVAVALGLKNGVAVDPKGFVPMKVVRA